MIKIHRSTKLINGYARAMLVIALAFVARNVFAQDEKSDLAVYYLSPQILTRSRMTPKRLKNDTFRINNIGSLTSEIRNVYSIIRLTDRKVFKGDVWRHDFRLCISVANDDTCFSSDGKVAYAKGGSFLLSASEERDVLILFRKLDSLGTSHTSAEK